MRVHVVYPVDGWILQRMGEEATRGMESASFGQAPDPSADINYFMNYNLLRKRVPGSSKLVAYFTHKEPSYYKSWERAENLCDAAVYMCRMYKPKVQNAYKIYPTGLDFKLDTPKLVIGVNSRVYKSGRKNEQALHTIDKTMYERGGMIKWRFRGAGWEQQHWLCEAVFIRPNDYRDPEEALGFYQGLDVLISMGKYEGGPIAVHEAVKVGVPVICSNTGAVEEWGGLVRVVRNAIEAAEDVNTMAALKEKRHNLCQRDWADFAKRHKFVFNKVAGWA